MTTKIGPLLESSYTESQNVSSLSVLHTTYTIYSYHDHFLFPSSPSFYRVFSRFLIDVQYGGATLFFNSSLVNHWNSRSPNSFLDRSSCPAKMRDFMKKTFSPYSCCSKSLDVLTSGFAEIFFCTGSGSICLKWPMGCLATTQVFMFTPPAWRRIRSAA